MEQTNFTEREKKIDDYLIKNDVWCKRDSNGHWEMSNYPGAGGDMNGTLAELSKDCLQEFIDDFDINDEVLIWWQPGDPWSGRKPGDGVPFSNVKEHYEDLEEWLDNLQEICNGMPE